MSWQTMYLEVAGRVPIPAELARIEVNRAWLIVQRKHVWSFLWGKTAIPTPSPISAGTCTLVRGSTSVTFDATAMAAIATAGLVNPITTRQFRIQIGTIYNIIAYSPITGIATLDQAYVDPQSGAGSNYLIYGVYFNAPVADFLWWESMVDPTTGYNFKMCITNEEVDAIDPQRFMSGWPRGPIPYKVNPNAGTFNGFPQYEMWPAPLNGLTFVGSYFRRGALFVNDSDTVNPMLGEDLVIALAKRASYEWCMVNPDKVPKGDYRFAYGLANAEYKALLEDYILKDEEFSHRHIINYPDQAFIRALPWVSAKEGLGYFPD